MRTLGGVIYLTLIAGLIVCLALPLTANIHASVLPNIVVFIPDDLGRWDTSIHASKDVRTPTLDRLSAAGMTFNNAYVASPSCCPSRFSLLTGLMPAHVTLPPFFIDTKETREHWARYLTDIERHHRVETPS